MIIEVFCPIWAFVNKPQMSSEMGMEWTEKQKEKNVKFLL